MVPVGNKAKRLSLVNDTTKAIHHHEVHGKVKLVKGQKKLTFSATQKEPSKKKGKSDNGENLNSSYSAVQLKKAQIVIIL